MYLGADISRIFHFILINNLFSYLKLMIIQDLEAKVQIPSDIIHGLMVLTGKGLQTIAFPFLKRSPRE